jgi:hypothetical protein
MGGGVFAANGRGGWLPLECSARPGNAGSDQADVPRPFGRYGLDAFPHSAGPASRQRVPAPQGSDLRPPTGFPVRSLRHETRVRTRPPYRSPGNVVLRGIREYPL